MEFDAWWEEKGCRSRAFCAKDFTEAGWRGHEIYGGEIIEEEDQLRLEDASLENKEKEK